MPQAPGNQPCQPDTQPGTQCRGDPHTKQVVTEYSLLDGDHPVTGNRLLEIAQAHKVWGYPVAAMEHFLADLCIAGFVRYP